MRISPSNGIGVNGVNSVSGPALQRLRTQRTEQERPVEHKFDTVTIGAGSSFQKELQSKISQEIRTATTTGAINALREQVQSGEYQVDARAIARQMLFAWEV